MTSDNSRRTSPFPQPLPYTNMPLPKRPDMHITKAPIYGKKKVKRKRRLYISADSLILPSPISHLPSRSSQKMCQQKTHGRKRERTTYVQRTAPRTFVSSFRRNALPNPNESLSIRFTHLLFRTEMQTCTRIATTLPTIHPLPSTVRLHKPLRKISPFVNIPPQQTSILKTERVVGS